MLVLRQDDDVTMTDAAAPWGTTTTKSFVCGIAAAEVRRGVTRMVQRQCRVRAMRVVLSVCVCRCCCCCSFSLKMPWQLCRDWY